MTLRPPCEVVLSLLLVMSAVAGGDYIDGNAVCQLLDNGMYEDAQVLIEKGLTDANDRGQRPLELARIEALRLNERGALEHFRAALGLLPSDPPVPEPVLPDVESILDVVELLRRQRLDPIASSILESLGRRVPHYSSLLFERANCLWGRRDALPSYFQSYYEAYGTNPRSRRAVATRAMIDHMLDANLPVAGNFPMLTAAVAYRDNINLWKMVMASMAEKGILKDQARANEFAGTLTHPSQDVFWAMYYLLKRDSSAAYEAVRRLESYGAADRRMDLFRRRLLGSLGRIEEAVNGLGPPSSGAYDQFDYYSFQIEAASTRKWSDANCVSYCTKWIDCLNGLSAPILPDAQVLSNANFFLRDTVRAMVAEGGARGAILLLKSNLGRLDPVNRRLLAVLCLSFADLREAMEILEGPTGRILLGENPSLLENALNRFLLEEKRAAFEQVLEVATERCYLSLVDRYRPLLQTIPDGPPGHKVALHIPSHCLLDGVSSTATLVGPGPCVKGCVYSMVRFWDPNVTFERIGTELGAFQAEGPGVTLHSQLRAWFDRNGFVLQYYVPCKEVVTGLLSAGVPVGIIFQESLLLGVDRPPGMRAGHMGVAYAYDDRSQVVHVEDIMGTGFLPFEDLPLAYWAVAAWPKARGSNPTPGGLRGLCASETATYGSSEIDGLAEREPLLKYWAYRQNGSVSLAASDPNSIQWLERCLECERMVSDVDFYVGLVAACRKHNEIPEARRYLREGLEQDPNSLRLLESSVDLRLAEIDKGSPIDYDVLGRMLEVTRRMEQLDPDYPGTYLLRLRICLKLSAPRSAIDATVGFLRSAGRASLAWQRQNAKVVEWARGSLSRYRKELVQLLRSQKGTEAPGVR